MSTTKETLILRSNFSEPGFPGSEKFWNRNFPEPGMRKYREIGRSTLKAQVLKNILALSTGMVTNA